MSANALSHTIPPCSGIYCLEFKTGELYIGGSSNMRARINTHLSWLRKGVGQNAVLQRVYDKVGAPTQKVLIICARETLRLYEEIAHRALRPKLSKLHGGGSIGVVCSSVARSNMKKAAILRGDNGQSARQLETWKDPEIKARRLAGTAAYVAKGHHGACRVSCIWCREETSLINLWRHKNHAGR